MGELFSGGQRVGRRGGVAPGHRHFGPEHLSDRRLQRIVRGGAARHGVVQQPGRTFEPAAVRLHQGERAERAGPVGRRTRKPGAVGRPRIRLASHPVECHAVLMIDERLAQHRGVDPEAGLVIRHRLREPVHPRDHRRPVDQIEDRLGSRAQRPRTVISRDRRGVLAIEVQELAEVAPGMRISGVQLDERPGAVHGGRPVLHRVGDSEPSFQALGAAEAVERPQGGYGVPFGGALVEVEPEQIGQHRLRAGEGAVERDGAPHHRHPCSALGVEVLIAGRVGPKRLDGGSGDVRQGVERRHLAGRGRRVAGHRSRQREGRARGRRIRRHLPLAAQHRFAAERVFQPVSQRQAAGAVRERRHHQQTGAGSNGHFAGGSAVPHRGGVRPPHPGEMASHRLRRHRAAGQRALQRGDERARGGRVLRRRCGGQLHGRDHELAAVGGGELRLHGEMADGDNSPDRDSQGGHGPGREQSAALAGRGGAPGFLGRSLAPAGILQHGAPHQLVVELIAPLRWRGGAEQAPAQQLLASGVEALGGEPRRLAQRRLVGRGPETRHGLGDEVRLFTQSCRAALDHRAKVPGERRRPSLRVRQGPGASLADHERPFVHQCGDQLDAVERVAARLLVDPCREGVPLRGGQHQHRGHQGLDLSGCERRELESSRA